MEIEPTQPPGSTSQRHRRRALLGGVAALTACAAPPKAAPAEPAVRAALPAAPPPAPVAAVPLAPAPEPVPAPAPAPQPSISDLGLERIVQPFWSGDGTRVLYYDQPAAGQGGTWAVEPGGQPAQERAQWGYYVSRGTLLVTPRPDRRDTSVLHLPSGRQWTLATTNGTLFSADGTVVTYSAAAAQPGGGGGGSRNFQPTTLALGGADGQGMRRVALPINASPVAWIPGRDGSENGRLLLTGRRNRTDGTAFYVLDLRDGSLNDFGRSRRLLGPLVSPSGQWVAYVAMWNGDTAQNGLWVSRTDGTQPRRLEFMAGYRWTDDDRLILIPVRRSAADSHEVWDLTPDTWALRRLTDPAQTPFRVANFDWDLSPDGTGIVFVSADTRRLAHLSLPGGLEAAGGAAPAGPLAPDAPGSAPYRLPFQAAPGPSAWYIAQWYGVTTGGYRARNSAYREGQGIHFGIDFATPLGTPVVALAPGRVIAVDGNYGSPPHNVVIQLPDGNQAMYGHLMEPSRHVQVGQTVEAGQVVGNTGDSSAPYDGYGNPHIHLEVRKRGRDVATNLVPNFDVNWDDLSLGVYPGPRFERNLDDPRRYQFPDDQPDIRFGGAIITNFSRPWPP
jgi:murein DD-endopeptidase MepM/ murein hydrolase activator NlpD